MVDDKVNTTLVFPQIGEGDVTDAVGTGITVTVVDAETPEHGEVVTVYVYVVVTAGVTAKGKEGAVNELAYNVPPGAAVIV